MIDIHCHILPCLDDGPVNLGQSLEMCRLAEKDGIRTIVATPHIRSPFPRPERISLVLSLLNLRLAEEKISVTVLSGGEVNVLEMPPDPETYVLHKGPYLLIEFPHTHLPGNARELLFRLCADGLVPIITHPERNGGVLRNPARLEALLDSNIKVQVNAESLTGYFGADVAECARFLLKRRIVHFLGTDAHSPTDRRPVLSRGRKNWSRTTPRR